MRTKLHRRKAFLGESLAAAGITAAATLAAAGMGVAATNKSAKTQADATLNQARMQAESLDKQNELSRSLQKESIDFTKSENELNRQLQKDAQMNIQLAMGMQNTNEAKEASKIQVKKGGSVRRKLKLGANRTPFYGGADDKFPFVVTDGGGVLPIYSSPEGNLYEIAGDNHEQSHKAKNGRKTGVGFKFVNGREIEGEGNGNTNNGELLYTTPEDAYFISKHTINGYNPREDVMRGTHPLVAFNRQEAAKHTRRRAAFGATTLPGTGMNISSDASILQDATNMLPIINMAQRTSAKLGDNARQNLANPYSNVNVFGGAGINAAANLIGAGLTAWGNNRAARRLGRAYNQAGQIMSDAYSRMHGINLDAISRDDYRAAHVIPALQSTVVRNNADRENIARQTRDAERRINNTSLSGAARLNRLAGLQDRNAQALANVTQAENQAMAERQQANMQAANAAAMQNAQLDTQANQQYSQGRLALMQYNNDIENQKIMGIGQSQADALMGRAQTRASAIASNMGALSSGLTASAQGFSSAMQARVDNEYNLRTALAFADTDAAGRVLGTMGPQGERLAKQMGYDVVTNPNGTKSYIWRGNNNASNNNTPNVSNQEIADQNVAALNYLRRRGLLSNYPAYINPSLMFPGSMVKTNNNN